MTNQALIQRHVNKGYNKAAQRLGVTFVQYRPRSTGPVLINDNIVAEQMLAFDQGSGFPFTEPQDYNDNKFYALVDLSFVQVGDYFWDYDKTIFFAAWIEPIKPAELILCNHFVDIYTPAAIANGYGGNTDPIIKLRNWPVSLLPGTKGESNDAKTPGAIRAPWGEMRLPQYPGIEIFEYDLVIDEAQHRFIISQASLAKEGWFCTLSRENV